MAKKKVKKVVKKKSIVKKSKTVAKKAKSVVKKTKQKPAAKKKIAAVTKSKSAVQAASKPAKTIKSVDLKNFVTPLDDRLIVQVEEVDRMTAGGLYIPDTVSDSRTYFQGTILAVGRGHRDIKGRLKPMDVKVGDQILFDSISGAKLTYQSVDLKILRETDVMGVVDKD